MNSQFSNPKSGAFGFVVLMVILLATETFREFFSIHFGFWGGLVVTTLLNVILVFAICLLVRLAWQRAICIALMIALTLNTFDALRTALDPHLNQISAITVSGIGAAGCGLLVGFSITRRLGIFWS